MEVNLARSVAWSFHASTGIAFEDLLQEACIAYVIAERDPHYDPRKSAMTSFALTCMRNHLSTITVRLQKNPPAIRECPDLPSPAANPEEVAIFNEKLRELSAEAKFIIKLIFDSPYEYISLNSRDAQRSIKEHMQQQGYTISQVKSGIEAVKAILV